MNSASDRDPPRLGLPPPLLTTETDQGDLLSINIVNAVAALSGRPAAKLPTLHDAIDTDALDRLFSGRSSNGVVLFRYAGYTVCVAGDTVRIHEANSSTG